MSRLVALAASLVLLFGPAVGRALQAPSPEVVFLDDFDGPVLDRSKWGVFVTERPVNNEQQAYVDSPDTIEMVRVGDGSTGPATSALAIHPRSSPGYTTAGGRTFDFISGRLEGRGKESFTYGTLAARIKLSPGAGIWPAFWALGDGRWPEMGEMDVMENVGDPGWTSVALHGPGYSGDTPLVRRFVFPAGQDITGWHVYSLDWKPDGFVFRMDDIEVYRVTRAMVEQYGRWVYDTPKFLILNVAIGGEYPQSVNHAQTPYPGLPASTVDAIKSGGGTMLVDWVRVTR